MRKIFYILIYLLFISLNPLNAKDILPIIEGDKNSKINLVIYESLTCSHCGEFHRNVYPKLKEEFIDKGIVNIEFRNFPLDLAALNASKIAHCKNDGLSNTLHFLYQNQERWVKGNNILEVNNNLMKLLEIEEININFEKCVNDKKIENFILEERIDGSKKYEIEATPTLIINEKKFDKQLNYKNLKKTLKKML